MSCTYISTDSTHTHSHTCSGHPVYLISCCLVILPLYISTSITPVSLHVVTMILELTLYIVCLLNSYLFFSSITLLGFEFARKAFHCSCVCYINLKPLTANVNKGFADTKSLDLGLHMRYPHAQMWHGFWACI